MKTDVNQLTKTFDLVLVALMVALLIISAKLSLAVGPIPLSLQTLIIVLTGILLGSKRGSLVAMVYLFIGLIGLPVFTKGGGISYLAQPSFGFLLGFIPAATLSGLLGNWQFLRPAWLRIFLAGLVGMVIIYSCGLAYIPLATVFFGSKLAVWAVLLPTLPLMMLGDLIKLLFITSLAPLLQLELARIRGRMAA